MTWQHATKQHQHTMSALGVQTCVYPLKSKKHVRVFVLLSGQIIPPRDACREKEVREEVEAVKAEHKERVRREEEQTALLESLLKEEEEYKAKEAKQVDPEPVKK